MVQMPPGDWYYTADPIKKRVSKEEFDEYIKNYPRKLDFDVCGIAVPPALSWNDFELADRWPYSVVSNTWAYEDDPEHYFYTPEDERSYYIVENIEEVFASKTGRTVKDWEKECERRQEEVADDKANIPSGSLWTVGATKLTITDREGVVVYEGVAKTNHIASTVQLNEIQHGEGHGRFQNQS